jgi:hypothetical protein
MFEGAMIVGILTRRGTGIASRDLRAVPRSEKFRPECNGKWVHESWKPGLPDTRLNRGSQFRQERGEETDWATMVGDVYFSVSS